MSQTKPLLGAAVSFVACLLVSLFCSALFAKFVARVDRKEPVLLTMEILLLLAQISCGLYLWRRSRAAALGVLAYVGCELLWVAAALLVFPRA